MHPQMSARIACIKGAVNYLIFMRCSTLCIAMDVYLTNDSSYK